MAPRLWAVSTQERLDGQTAPCHLQRRNPHPLTPGTATNRGPALRTVSEAGPLLDQPWGSEPPSRAETATQCEEEGGVRGSPFPLSWRTFQAKHEGGSSPRLVPHGGH